MKRFDLSEDSFVLNAQSDGKRAMDWVSENEEIIQERLSRQGALLIRGLNIISGKQFGSILSRMFGAELLKYSYRSTPRTGLKGNVYTATEYHKDKIIPMHNENSYSNVWPMNIGFLCMVPAEKGGETPIVDSRIVYEKIPITIRKKFEEKGVKYVRNYGDIDLPWEEVFQTSDKHEVEAFCNENKLKYKWLDDNRLRTWQVNQATALHPVTNEWVWLNQAHLFHISSVDKETRASMLSMLGEDNLPRNTYYGDGSQIEESDLEVIRQVYKEEQFTFSWQKNDFLLLDNMLYAHGRRPFEGERKVLVGMAKPFERKKESYTSIN